MKVSRIRLSDKTSRLHPRHVVPKPAQAHESEVPVKVREWSRGADEAARLATDAITAGDDDVAGGTSTRAARAQELQFLETG
jgi:hypothetical protein